MQLEKASASIALNARSVRAVSFVRPMIGRSGPALVAADDGAFYVVKTWGNLHHPNALANEYLGSALCEAVGLPVPPSRQIELTQEFLNHTSLSASYKGYTHHPKPGIHYASSFVLPQRDDAFLIELLCQHYVQFVQNRGDFLGMYMLDVCFGHQGPRQAVFVKSKSGPASRAIFIDHDHMFGGSNWETASVSNEPYHRTTKLYDGLLTRKEVASWLETFNTKLPAAVDSAVKGLPSEWYTGNLGIFHEWLHHRIQFLPELIDQVLTRDQIHREYADATMHIPNPWICQIGP